MDIELTNQALLDVSHKVASIGFRHYTDEEIAKLSLCKIKCERAFDELGRPVRNGLYDPRLGATCLEDGICVTCRLDYFKCPGHFGHIELPFPAVNPNCFRIVKQLLSIVCWHCRKLRHSQRYCSLLLALLRFDQAGRLDCVAATRYWTGTITNTSNSATPVAGLADIELNINKSLEKYLDSLPEVMKRRVGTVDLQTMSLESVDKAIVLASKDVWEEAVTQGMLENSPTDFWRQQIREFETEPPKKCSDCLNLGMKVHISRNRLFVKRLVSTTGESVVFPGEIYEVLKEVWKKDEELLGLIYGQAGRISTEDVSKSLDHNVFFVRNVAVPPSRFRPSNSVGAMEASSEHPQNIAFTNILEGINILAEIDKEDKANSDIVIPVEMEAGSDSEMSDDIQTVNEKPEKLKKVSLNESVNKGLPSDKNRRIGRAIQQMQMGLCLLYDNKPSKLVPISGVRQQLEAKEGMFRMHMMGKRVNFSCRSVIGPDLFLEPNEVGIPESFARLLSVPEYVTNLNLREMQAAVMNGAQEYPGALAVEKWSADGRYRAYSLKRISELERNRLAESLVSDNEKTLLPCRVRRHLKNGDIVLFNRQPTLHRVSIMAQKVRILPGDRTIRFHYANCKSYNADFDGDEMNVHVMQDHLARAEAKELMLSSKHYIAPTSGEPVRGLIQDHVAAGAVLSSKDTWMERQRFCQLLYESTAAIVERRGYQGGAYRIPEPAIIKPKNLWSGKQLISAVLNIVRGDKPGLNLIKKSKTSAKIVGREESVVIIRNGEFLVGTFDKSSIGASVFGAVHGIQEVYGNEASDDFLGAFGKLGTFYLRGRGHSTGIEDLLLQENAEKQRLDCMVGKLNEVAIKATNEVYESFTTDAIQSGSAKDLDGARRMTEEMIRVHGAKAEDSLDTAMKSALNGIQSEVTNSCLPKGLSKSYPVNGFSLMTTTGAKGSDVNSAQISCVIGSTSLEGKRVPRMGGSGATLPCFEPYDASPNAGGFIASRFLTGIKPFEFFFHAMAGREGLLDTSLKTANSGYLQRCLIKAMEGIKLDYDYTVRDSDGKVVQFLYGDDGLDPTKCRFLTEKMSFQIDNMKGLNSSQTKRDPEVNQLLEVGGKKSESSILEELSPGVFSKSGAVSEKFRDNMMDFIRQQRTSDDDKKTAAKKERKMIRFLESRYQRCVVEPGEPVGVIAAQGVGEPSTQMTLNTFHHAGSSSAHVTLGIPRLRELLMTASKYPKTPSMTLPIRAEQGKKGAEKLVKRLREVKLVDLLDAVEIETVQLMNAKELADMFVALVKIKLKFPKPETYSKMLGVSFEELYASVSYGFQGALAAELKTRMKRAAASLSGTPSARKLLNAIALMESDEDVQGSEGETQRDKQFIADDVEEDEEEEENKSDGEVEGIEEKNDSSSSSESEDSDNESGEYENTNKDDDEESINVDENEDKEIQEVERVEKDEKEDDDKEMKDMDEKKKRANGFKSIWRVGPVDEPVAEADKTEIWLPWILPFSIMGRIRIPEMIRDVAKNVKIRKVEKIGRCFVNENKGQYEVVTEGSNILQALKLGYGLVDFDGMITNDMYGILHTYGVEAMRLALVQEFEKVFDAYGIPVNIRHLSLIADYMTQLGGYRGFNRMHIVDCVSTFQKMTFETSTKFLKEAVMYGGRDLIENPSAAIAINATYRGGTGSVDLVTKL